MQSVPAEQPNQVVSWKIIRDKKRTSSDFVLHISLLYSNMEILHMQYTKPLSILFAISNHVPTYIQLGLINVGYPVYTFNPLCFFIHSICTNVVTASNRK